MLFFKSKNTDYAVIEVGLGGKNDATNIVIPEVSVITSVSLDHTKILGSTVEEICKEKAGIIKDNVYIYIYIIFFLYFLIIIYI